MPCYDSRNSPDYVRQEVQAEMQGRVDQLTNWLCLTMGTLEQLGFHAKDPELHKWWEEHKAWDAARKEKVNE